MKVGVLGWGSLLWDPGVLKLATRWVITELCLPLEFSRKSSRDRLTLVLDTQHGRDVLIACAESRYKTIAGAVRNLSKRERCAVDDIGVVRPKRVVRAKVPDLAERIRKMAEDSGLDAVIWTDLEPNFRFSIRAALNYLGARRSRAPSEARSYIALSPAMVETPLRERLRSMNWMACPDRKPATRKRRRPL